MKQLLLTVILVVAAIGCGESAPDPKVESDRLQGAKQMREFYDKAGGDYNRLTAEDRTQYLKSFGGNEENARRMWDTMGSRGGGTSMPGAPAPGMPGSSTGG